MTTITISPELESQLEAFRCLFGFSDYERTIKYFLDYYARWRRE